jgi:hypothetical protein
MSSRQSLISKSESESSAIEDREEKLDINGNVLNNEHKNKITLFVTVSEAATRTTQKSLEVTLMSVT